MRGLTEFAGQVTRLVYSEELGKFVSVSEPHPFLERRTPVDGGDRLNPTGVSGDCTIAGNSGPPEGEQPK